MNTELSEAYFGVYSSSKEILKNNQRHLYCNMLDLLSNTCKTTGVFCLRIPNDEQVKFWLSDILPLTFENDPAIQASAVAAMQQGLLHMEAAMFHESSHWAALKNEMVTKLAPSINKLREDKNQYWHQIWCILIQILDKEILKGASTINSFLSIVELGFRNPDSRIRAEAFHCWRLLIKIFATYNELSSAKRMKLICIPLKSSQSKSSHSAEIKLRVWWYLFSCLGQQLEQYFENVVETFLMFCFGSPKNNMTAIIQQYPSNRELALACLAALLCTESNTFLERILKDKGLEQLSQPSPIINLRIFQKFWHPIVNSVMEALHLFDSEEANLSETEQQLLHIIIKSLAITIMSFDIPAFRIFTFNELGKFSNTQSKPIIPFLNTFASEGLAVQNALLSLDEYGNLLDTFIQMLYKFKALVPRAILQRSIDSLLKLPEDELQKNQLQGATKILSAIIDFHDDIDFDYFELKLMMWRRLSPLLINMLKSNHTDLRMSEFAVWLQPWTVWPVKVAAAFAGSRGNLTFDTFFWETWRQLVLNGQNSLLGNALLSNVLSILKDIIASHKDEAWIPEIYDIFVQAVLKYGLLSDSGLRNGLIQTIKSLFKSKVNMKTLEGCLNTFRNMLTEAKKSEFEQMVPEVKEITADLLKVVAKGDISSKYSDEWKRTLLDKAKTCQNKSLASQFKELFKGSDVFVIIPSVWSLNPDKLTERQKEKYSEKNDIPALYNDMSQSQDSSIKPWTPKKIVLLKEDQKEISIENSNKQSTEQTDNCYVDQDKVLGSTPSKPETSKKPEKPAENSEIFPSKEYNFRRRSTGVEEVGKAETNVSALNSSITELNTQKPHRPLLRSKTTEEAKLKSPPKKKTSSTSGDTCKAPIPERNDAPSAETIDVEKQVPLGAKADLEIQPEAAVAVDIDSKLLNKGNETSEDQLPPPPTKENDAIESKEVSPKKTLPQRFSSLGSPPDRRLTTNISSPILRPKPTSHLTGRGAQLINMIRNKKLDSPHASTSKAANSSSISTSSSASTATTNQVQKDEKKSEVNPIASELIELTCTDNTSTPMIKDLLIFSKRLPSPTASPSASILKRKLRRDSLEDISIESPALKRKRVSFHDPPVSVTKEYIKDNEDTKLKPKRCLILDKQNQSTSSQTPENSRYALKRRNKLDSLIELEKCAVAANTPTTTNTTLNRSAKATDESMSSLKWNEGSSHSVAEKETDTTCVANSAKDLDSALDLVLQNYSISDLLDKVFTSSHVQPVKASHLLAKFISNQMSNNSKIKATVLETLSENHSKDFLDHAVQENLSSVVCDRLNVASVIDYICAKSKINTNCRNNLLQQIPDVLKNCRVDSDRLHFITSLLNSCTFTDENILEIISLLMGKRERIDRETADCVSESAADSSSNL